jgi:hypothetical protein
VDARGDQIYDEIYNSLWWERAQEEIRMTHPSACVAGIILSSDELNLSEKTKSHNVYLSSANVPLEHRRKSSGREVSSCTSCVSLNFFSMYSYPAFGKNSSCESTFNGK